MNETTVDLSESAYHRRNFIMLVWVYLGCCLVIAGVMFL